MYPILFMKNTIMQKCLMQRLHVFTDYDTYTCHYYYDWIYAFKLLFLEYKLPDGYPTCFHKYSLEPPLLCHNV